MSLAPARIRLLPVPSVSLGIRFTRAARFQPTLRATKGFRWWKDHGIFLFGIGVYNLTNHTNALKVSEYYGLTSYRGLIETLNARQVQWSWQWEF